MGQAQSLKKGETTRSFFCQIVVSLLLDVQVRMWVRVRRLLEKDVKSTQVGEERLGDCGDGARVRVKQRRAMSYEMRAIPSTQTSPLS